MGCTSLVYASYVHTYARAAAAEQHAVALAEMLTEMLAYTGCMNGRPACPRRCVHRLPELQPNVPEQQLGLVWTGSHHGIVLWRAVQWVVFVPVPVYLQTGSRSTAASHTRDLSGFCFLVLRLVLQPRGCTRDVCRSVSRSTTTPPLPTRPAAA